MGEQTMQQRGAHRAADPASGTRVAGPRQGPLTQLATTLNAAPAVQRVRAMAPAGAPVAQLVRHGRRSRMTPAAKAGSERLLEKRAQKAERQRIAAEAKKARSHQASEALKGNLQAEIARRDKRRSDMLTAKAADIRKTGRPTKPDTLVHQDETGASLTAHHLYPYNRLEGDFTSAMEKQDLPAVRNLMAFKGDKSTDESEAFRLLGYQRDHKPGKAWIKHQGDARKEQKKLPNSDALPRIEQNAAPTSNDTRLDNAFKATAWAPHNVFMGPEPKNRTDDPHEGLDQRVTRDGRVTAPSLLAKEMADKGVGKLDNADFHRRLAGARKDADKTRPYSKDDWADAGGGKRSQAGLSSQKQFESVVKHRTLNMWPGR